MAKSDNLRKAKEVKNDEFYTQLDDIVAEIAQHKDYVRQFQGKTVFCNCDDPEWSSFVEFFRKFFKKLGLKKMICTHYEKDGSPSYKLEWSGEKIHGDTVNMIKTPLKGNGDFRSEECIELLKEADIVVTNPPFSLFREYIAQLMEYDKKFVIIGNKNAIAYKEVFPLLRDGKMFVGYNAGNGTMHFATEVIDNKRIGAITHSVPSYWYTNLDLDKSHEPLILTKNYVGNEDKYPRYANFDAIECGHETKSGNWQGDLKMIPKDYFGRIGVPITYMAQHCADQFDILGMGTGDLSKMLGAVPYNEILQGDALARMRELRPNYGALFSIDENGMPKLYYNRIIIQRKPVLQED